MVAAQVPLRRKGKAPLVGRISGVSLKETRAKRDDARRLLANDIDPSAQRQAGKSALVEHAANSFETIAREWFAKFSQGWVESHSAKIIRRLERDVFSWLGEILFT